MPSFPLKFTAFTAAVIRLLLHAAVISDFLVFCFWFAALALACFRFIPRKTFIRFTQPAAQPRCGKLIFPSQSVVYGVFVCVCVFEENANRDFSHSRGWILPGAGGYRWSKRWFGVLEPELSSHLAGNGCVSLADGVDLFTVKLAATKSVPKGTGSLSRPKSDLIDNPFYFFAIGRLTDEVESLEAILMDDVQITRNERYELHLLRVWLMGGFWFLTLFCCLVLSVCFFLLRKIDCTTVLVVIVDVHYSCKCMQIRWVLR